MYSICRAPIDICGDRFEGGPRVELSLAFEAQGAEHEALKGKFDRGLRG
jgi:hypothetical protein